MDSDPFAVTRTDARALLAAAETAWTRRVPHCPDWDLAGLVRHTGSIFTWMAAIVTSGERTSWRSLPPAPQEPADLPDWYREHLEETLGVFAAAEPDARTWTFSSLGEHRAGWWFRRIGIEVAIHRWDAQYAASPAQTPEPLDGDIARSGIDEYVTEFLPGLLARADQPDVPTGTLHLQATDGPVEWFVDLDHPELATHEHRRADAAVRGTRSDLLLWLVNRDPAQLDFSGRSETAQLWTGLTR